MSDHDENPPRPWTWSTIGEVTQAGVEQAPPEGNTPFLYVDISSIDNRTKKIVAPKLCRLPTPPAARVSASKRATSSSQ
jgi:hypothetical protein